jgi:putative hydrolase of the HAD superfamily
MLDRDDPHLTSLLVADQDAKSPDHELAALHLPILKFDAREPFLPLAVGFSIFRDRGPSPSFPRTINPSPDEVAIEYAIWWDWDIGHLYELEHAWVYLDSAGQPSRGEASWHGDFNSMGRDGSLPLDNGRLSLFSEPGKHAFAPVARWFKVREDRNVWDCCQGAGNRGLLKSNAFRGELPAKSALVDRMVQAYLRGFAFEPTYRFERLFPLPTEMLVPWASLREWIPDRIELTIQWLERLELPKPETLNCERAA